MRIERVEIDGFGRFHAASWDLSPGLTVLLGANEAGKTTLLNALRALLFGFESSRDGRAWYAPLAGGRRGGRLVLATGQNERWVVERHGDRGGAGALAVRAPNGNQGGQETLDRLLHEADKDLFTNIFAFGLGELQTFASLNAEGVRGRIYGARAGLGGTSAIDLERRLRQEMDSDFLPSGSKRPLNALLARIESLRAEIAALSRQPEEHAEAHRERERLVAEADAARHEARRLREDLVRVRTLREAAPIVAALDAVDTELAAGDPTLDDLPEDAVPAVERRVAALEKARAVLATIDDDVREATRTREGLAVDEPILAVAAELAALVDERGRRRAAGERRADLLATTQRAAGIVDEQVAQSGGMTEAALLALDHSIPTLEAIREHDATLARARAAQAEAEARLRALVDVEAGAGAAPVDADRDLDARLAAFRELEALRIARIGAAGAPLAPWSLVGGVAAFLVAVLLGAQLGAPFAGAAVGLVLGAAVLLLGRRAGGTPEPDAERWAAACRVLGLPASPAPQEIAAVGEELAAARARRDLAAADGSRTEARRARVAAREQDVTVAEAAVREAETAWCAWLAARSLPGSLSPEAARQVLGAAATARRAATERDAAREGLASLDADDAAFAARADALVVSLGLPAPEDGASRDARLLGLAERLETARDASRRAAELDARLAQLAERRAPASAEVEAAEAALAGELSRLGAPDVETLRRRAASAAERRGLRATAREHRLRLAGLVGVERVGEIEAEARRADPAALEAMAAETAARLEEVEARERDATAAIGATDARIAQLEATAELGDRRQELAVLEGQAAELARRWAVRALTLRLLSATRARHERERQPDVVRAAETHFARITDGRYARIIAPPGEAAVRVETEGGESRMTDELSRGTAEQLYLALRFGLIEEFAAHAEPLPVVMDDILVNFDAQRAARAASAIRSLAERHQVLYFTCHPWTAKLLDADGTRTVTLG
ncbi:MAG TPA: AAA family ATPase [Candidatus Limnocylindria bacterium]|nr:AAA family ATPase [Candidatus Limnocylindria bacterium]